MDPLSVALGVSLGISIGAFICYLILLNIRKTRYISKFEHDALTLRHSELASSLRLAENQLVNQERLISQNELAQKEINNLIGDNGFLKAQNQGLNEKLQNHKAEVEELRQVSHLQFEKIANQILEHKSEKFTAANKLNIEALLKPLDENLKTFKKKVEETYDKESQQRFSLEEKVRELILQTDKVSAEANNLASALKGQSKKQGSWGEMILESILQSSGLEKDREYFVQKTIQNDEGKNLRPDVIVALPDERMVIIDSKVSLTAYDRFSSAATEEQEIHLAEHLKSIYRHIDELSAKKYDDHASSLDFTMMFIPIEPAYLIAAQSDQELWNYAYARRILLTSPTNLIACLKLISDLWKRELQSKNALEIVKRGERLYEKFISFTESLKEIGKNINRAQLAYDNALIQLKTGKGNLVEQAVKLKKLGLKSDKKITAEIAANDEGGGEAIESEAAE